MWGMIAKITSRAGRRDEMVETLQESATGMPGCLSYIVCTDKSDENVLWVTEVWDREESHAASLKLPAVKAAMARGRTLVANFERIATTEPVWGYGLPTSGSA